MEHPVQNKYDHLASIGSKTVSGFTNSHNNEPITHQNKCCYDSNKPYRTNTRLSFMRSAYQPMVSADGKEECKLLSQRATKQNGYTSSSKARPEYTLHRLDTYTKTDNLKPFQVEKLRKNSKGDYFDVLYASPFPSMTTASFPRHQNTNIFEDVSATATHIGPKQDTGFTENNRKFIQSADADTLLNRFDTHYKLRYYDRNPKLINDAFLGCRNVANLKENGFVKSTRIQTVGEKPVTVSGKQVSTIHPYVARSLRARDPSYIARCQN